MAYENVRFNAGEEKVVIVDDCERVVKRATIDRETGNYMFKQYEDRNNPNHKRFEIVIGGTVVDLWLFNQLDKKTDTMIWTLEKYFVNGSVHRDEVFDEVKKAFEAYGCLGLTYKKQKKWYEKYNEENPNGFAKVCFGRFK